HDLDIVLGLVDSPPRRLTAVGSTVHSGSVDVANVQIVFESGTIAIITASRATEEKIRTLAVTQADAYIVLEVGRASGRDRVWRLEFRRVLFRSHGLDIVLGLVDSPPRRLTAVGSTVHSGSVDVANVQIVFESGTIAIITASRATEEKIRTLAVTQADAYIVL